MDHNDTSFFRIAMEHSVRTRAARIALVVGTILALINHGDRLIAFDLGWTEVFKIALTFMVPYCVSTYSSVLAVRERMQMLSPD